jgi:hypothetical protein
MNNDKDLSEGVIGLGLRNNFLPRKGLSAEVQRCSSVRNELNLIVADSSCRDNKNEKLTKLGIEVIPFDGDKISDKNIQCHVCTLGLEKSKKFLTHKESCRIGRVVSECNCPKIQSNFMQELIFQFSNSGIIQKLESPEVGCMILYFGIEESNRHLTHSGLIVGNNPIIVPSKWGSHPDLLRHRLWKIPHSYGFLDPLYYTRPNLQDVEDFYLQWSNEKI